MALQPRASPSPVPFVFAPSQAWEGNDGPWSTFVIRVGTPEQVFHVLISTLGQETWVPVPEGCLATDPANCGELRGVLPFQNQVSNGFQVNASSTWIPQSLYELAIEDHLNYTGNGEYGFDTVGLQLPLSGGVSLPHQVVAGIATKDFYLGVFSLGPKPTNFTNFNTPAPSFMWSLKNQSIISSLSWGYTAGSPYREKKVLGSLTLGGYDASRFQSNTLNFTFSDDDSRPLTVGLQAIQAKNTFKGVSSLLPAGILTVIDSTVPEIWLPSAACTIFEAAFGLSYDPHTDRYLVNDTIRQQLLTMNPTITFKLGNTVDGGDSVLIDFPYGAFDLQLEYPIYPSSTKYFPLRRAMNDTQYTLGRTFLQEAYVIADYERSNFSVAQTTHNAPTTPQLIIPILPPSNPAPYSSGLSHTTLIAIIIAVLIPILLLSLTFYIILRLRRKKRAALAATTTVGEMEASAFTANANKHASYESGMLEIGSEADEAERERLKHFSGVSELAGRDKDLRHELNTVESPAELITVESPMELQGSPVPVSGSVQGEGNRRWS